METLVVKAVESTVGEPVEIGRGARVAQLAEQGTLNPKVLGSIPGAGTTCSTLTPPEYDPARLHRSYSLPTAQLHRPAMGNSPMVLTQEKELPLEARLVGLVDRLDAETRRAAGVEEVPHQ
jgi:hypothetical protein